MENITDAIPIRKTESAKSGERERVVVIHEVDSAIITTIFHMQYAEVTMKMIRIFCASWS